MKHHRIKADFKLLNRNRHLNVALLSPNENAYSETFINAHKERINANIFYYYGGFIPEIFEKYNERIEVGNLSQSFLKNEIDVVFAEYGVTAAESLPAIEKAGLPLVVHFHGFDAHNDDIIQEYQEQYKKVFEYAFSVIVVSMYMRKKIIEMGCPESKVIYTVCAPNDDFFEVRPKFRKQQFFAVGRFVDKKAPYYTILAFKKVCDNNPQARLKMAGDGPLLATCRNLTKYLKLEERVEFIGVVDRDRIKSEMEESLAFVQHSIVAENGDSEGTPVAVMESGAAGLPVISTRHAGIKDVVIEGRTGLLVEEHDVDGMASAMEKLIENVEFAKILGGNARNNIMNKYSMNKHISTLERELYQCASIYIKKTRNKISLYYLNHFEIKNKIKFMLFSPKKFIKKHLFKINNIFHIYKPKILIVVNHYYGECGEFKCKSATQHKVIRRKIVERVIEELQKIPNAEIKVCGIEGRALVKIDKDFSHIKKPAFLVYESIEWMSSQVDKFDYFINIEDDVLLSKETFEKILEFDCVNEIKECFHPNRLEFSDDGNEYCVDLLAWPGWKKDKQKNYKGNILRVANNPHSGISVLSKKKLKYALKSVDFKKRDKIIGHYMASAFANLHEPFLMFRTYDKIKAHNVVHLDRWEGIK